MVNDDYIPKGYFTKNQLTVRNAMNTTAFVTAGELAALTGLSVAACRKALRALWHEGSVVAGERQHTYRRSTKAEANEHARVQRENLMRPPLSDAERPFVPAAEYRKK